MQLSAWNAGSTYGLRFGVHRSLVDARTVTLELEGGPTITVEVTDAFWRNCPEVRAPEIRDWFKRQRLRLPWPSGEPYKFSFTKVANNIFRVSYALR